MPSNYSGNPGNITTPLVATVSNCTSGPGVQIQVTTLAAHFFATYDYVTVSGVVGTVEANVTAQITVIDSQNFVLNGTVFANAYVSGGTATDLSLSPYFQVPDDGEYGTVQSIEASIQILADRTQYLQHTTAPLRVDSFTTAGAIVIVSPIGASRAIVTGRGGSGGGGGGGNGVTSATQTGGGGAGGGAVSRTVDVPVASLATYNAVLGAGGTAGAATVAGGIGGDTSFDSPTAIFRGSNGGTAGASSAAGDGGSAISYLQNVSPGGVKRAGDGGPGSLTPASVASDGAVSLMSVNAGVGTGGTGGASGTGVVGAGAGGGGGAPESLNAVSGLGGNGGNGGGIVSPGIGGNGTAAANGIDGGGGGGGGGGASATTTPGTGGSGGSGSDGILVIQWLR